MYTIITTSIYGQNHEVYAVIPTGKTFPGDVKWIPHSDVSSHEMIIKTPVHSDM
jgi:hypothetical protein